MQFKEYFKNLTVPERMEFAKDVGSSRGFLQNIAYGYRECSAVLAIAIERRSNGAVTCEEMRPDLTAEFEYMRTRPAAGLAEVGMDQ